MVDIQRGVNFGRFVIKGSLTGGESMTHTIHIAELADLIPGSGVDERQSTQSLCDKVATAWGRFLTTAPTAGGTAARTFLAPGTVYSSVDGYAISADTLKATEVVSSPITGSVAGTGLSALPAHLSVVASLRTAKAGRSKRGRLFLGGFAQGTMTSTGRLDPTVSQSLARGLAQFLQEARDVSNQRDIYRVVVYSQKLQELEAITTVSVGDVYDHMSSRRGSLVETRASGLVSAT